MTFSMVTVVQWLARLTVDQKVEGSNPSSHPSETALNALFFCLFIVPIKRLN